MTRQWGLEEQLRFESMMARLSARFVNLPAGQVESVIEEGQRLICQGLDLDRSSLFQRSMEDPDKWLLTHFYQVADPQPLPKPDDATLLSDREWADLHEAIPASYQHLDAKTLFPWTVEQVRRCETVCISRLADLPASAGRDRESYRGFGTKSTVVVPLLTEGTCIGFFTFASIRSERGWSEQILQRFRFIADLFTNALSRQRADRVLQVSVARYRSLIETQADVIARSDLEGRLTYVNDAYCRMFGMRREDLIGTKFYPTVLPEDLPISKSALKHIQRPPHRVTTETRHPTPHGIRWISWENTAVVDDSGNVLELQGTGRDVTERKQAQEALRKSEERYREFIGLSSEGIARFETEQPIDTSLPEEEQIERICRHGRLAECNQAYARMYGAEKAEEILGMTLEQMMDHSRSYDLELIRSFVRSGYRVVGAESNDSDPQGHPRHFSRSLDGVVEDGRLVRAWLLQHETTQQKLAEEGLRESERVLRQNDVDLRRLAGQLIYAQEEERRRLARELHDDLSQRLAILSMDADTLQQELSESEESLRTRIRDLQSRIVEISTEIHGISRRLHPSIIETLGLARAIASECSNFAQREHIEVQCDAQPIPAGVSSEVSLCIFRIVQEGLRNVARHAHASKVRVGLNVEEGALHLCIQDDGIGFNSDKGGKRRGLGLASIDERIRLIRGSVTIDSAPGKGTVIRVSVPLGEGALPQSTTAVLCGEM